MSTMEYMVYLGIILGVLAAFVLPWIKKNADLVAAGLAPVKFSIKYIYALVIEVFIMVFTVSALILAYPFPSGNEGLFAAFFAAWVYGMISAYTVKLPFDWLESRSKIVVKEPPAA